MEQQNENIVVLLDDEGNEFECEIVDMIDIEDRRYVIVVPDPNEEYVVPLRVETEDGEDFFVSVDDEDEFQEILEKWELSGEYDVDDEFLN